MGVVLSQDFELSDPRNMKAKIKQRAASSTGKARSWGAAETGLLVRSQHYCCSRRIVRASPHFCAVAACCCGAVLRPTMQSLREVNEILLQYKTMSSESSALQHRDPVATVVPLEGVASGAWIPVEIVRHLPAHVKETLVAPLLPWWVSLWAPRLRSDAQVVAPTRGAGVAAPGQSFLLQLEGHCRVKPSSLCPAPFHVNFWALCGSVRLACTRQASMEEAKEMAQRDRRGTKS